MESILQMQSNLLYADLELSILSCYSKRMPDKISLHHVRKHVHSKLQRRIVMYFVFSVLMLIFVVYEVVTGQLSLLYALGGLLVGLGIGWIIARMFRITWDKDLQKVVNRLDRFGVIVIVLYIVFSLLRRMLLSDFLQGNQLLGTSLALASGIMIGRLFGIGQKIIRVLRQEGIIS